MTFPKDPFVLKTVLVLNLLFIANLLWLLNRYWNKPFKNILIHYCEQYWFSMVKIVFQYWASISAELWCAECLVCLQGSGCKWWVYPVPLHWALFSAEFFLCCLSCLFSCFAFFASMSLPPFVLVFSFSSCPFSAEWFVLTVLPLFLKWKFATMVAIADYLFCSFFLCWLLCLFGASLVWPDLHPLTSSTINWEDMSCFVSGAHYSSINLWPLVLAIPCFLIFALFEFNLHLNRLSESFFVKNWWFWDFCFLASIEVHTDMCNYGKVYNGFQIVIEVRCWICLPKMGC